MKLSFQDLEEVVQPEQVSANFVDASQSEFRVAKLWDKSFQQWVSTMQPGDVLRRFERHDQKVVESGYVIVRDNDIYDVWSPPKRASNG